MKMRLLFFIFACLLTASCKKEKRYSIWTVNGEEFATNDVRIDEGKVLSFMSSNNDSINNFSLAFYTGKLPEQGVFNLGIPGPPDGFYKAGVTIRYHSKFYRPSPFELSKFKTLTATSINHKAQYKLEPTWFVNNYDSNDSVLVDGIFRVP